MKAQLGKDEGKILLGDNTGGEALILRAVRLHWLELGFQLDSLQYTYVFDHMNTFNYDLRKIRNASHLPERNYCVNRGVCMRENKATTL
jgi:hypothetical protein